MPVVRIDLRHPSQTGADAPAVRGATQWTPTRRRHVETGGLDYVVLPATVVGPAVGEITVAATGPGWCWRVLEAVTGGDPSPRYLAVPDVPGPLDYGDLAEVDPATLEPATPPTDAWLEALGSVADGIPGAVADYLTEHPPTATPEATDTRLGLVALAGDLAGTAQAPTVPALASLDARLWDVEARPTPDVSAADLAAHVADTAGVHGIVDTGALVVTTDPRLSDARPPVAHGHTLDEVTDAGARVAMVPAERAKLGGIAAGATANATDEALRDRATHTGVQPAETLSDLAETVQDIVAAFVIAGAGVTVSHDDDGNRFSIAADAGSITDPEIVRDVIGAALVAGAGVQITASDEGDTLTIASSAVLPTRRVTAGDGLMGGGDLSTDRAFAVAFGTTPGTVAEGDHGHNLAGLSAPGALAGRVLTADGTGGAGWSPVPATDLSAHATKAELAAAVGDVEAALGVILS